mgnify:CR=1 FL=1
MNKLTRNLRCPSRFRTRGRYARFLRRNRDLNVAGYHIEHKNLAAVRNRLIAEMAEARALFAPMKLTHIDRRILRNNQLSVFK